MEIASPWRLLSSRQTGFMRGLVVSARRRRWKSASDVTSMAPSERAIPVRESSRAIAATCLGTQGGIRSGRGASAFMTVPAWLGGQ